MFVLNILLMSSVRGTVSKALLMSIVAKSVRWAGGETLRHRVRIGIEWA